MKSVLALIMLRLLTLLLGATPALALDPSLQASQYGHTAWTAREGFSVGAIFAMAQTPDGYLWLGTEFGLFRFDGFHAVPWQPPLGQKLPNAPYALLTTRDGTLWIGTFAGLVSWNGRKLTEYPEIHDLFVTSLLEDHEGTVWAGILAGSVESPAGRLCAIRSGQVNCDSENGALGGFVWSLHEDNAGTLWAAAESGLWRWKPGSPKRYPMAGVRIDDLNKADSGNLLIAIRQRGLKQFVTDRLETYSIRSASNPNVQLPDRDVDSNKLLRDRDGGLWIGTHDRGIIHLSQGHTDVFTTADGLSGNIIGSLFEDREGNVWVGTTRGIDRFRELPINTTSIKHGLSDTNSLVAGADGSIWVATHEGLLRWKEGQVATLTKADGLPDDMVQCLYYDHRGRIWAFTAGGLAYFADDRFATVSGVTSTEIYSMTGDEADNLWLSGNRGLTHLLKSRLVEHFPWSALGRHQQAKVAVSDQGGVWLSFWTDGGVMYFKDGQVRANYAVADGLGKGHVSGLRIDSEGVVWAGTEGGLSRIKDGRIITLTMKNGLPCDTIHWSIEDRDGALWLYTVCGLVRITRSELQGWIKDPNRHVQTTVWDAADGIRVRAVALYFGPSVAKARDGRLWFNTGDGVQLVDPHHVAFNRIPPPVYIQQIVADDRVQWQNPSGAPVSNLRLPPRIRDLTIGYTALSLTDPEKVHFKFKLEGQDLDWREVVNDRQVQYSNLRPGPYRFHVIAANNSGVWNEQGDSLRFSIAPAYYQTNSFRALCAFLFLALLWAVYQWRVRQLHHDFETTLEARVSERTRIARDLHDTLLQSFHGLLLRFQTVSLLLPERPIEAKEKLDSAIDQAAGAITEGRDAVQGLRASTVERNDLALAIRTLGEELQTDSTDRHPVTFRVAVEGRSRELHPILRDEVYKIAAEALRNAFHHAQAKQIEVEIRYDHDQFRLRVRDDGKGIDAAVLSSHDLEGHYGLRGMRERATLIKGKLVVWSEVDAGTEVELRVPATAAYTTARKSPWLIRRFVGRT